MEFKLYPKIPGVYKRYTEGPERNKLITGEWTSPELGMLAEVPWDFTEKIDGTNIRIGWDGHSVSFGGRTNKAEIPRKLMEHLTETFPEELMEQAFGETETILYGEGCGKGIQKAGKLYGDELRFILFDVRIGRWWLRREDVVDVARKLGIPSAPIKIMSTLHGAIEIVRNGLRSDWDPEKFAEGIVGVPFHGLCSRSGQRIMVKIKHEDFYKGES